MFRFLRSSTRAGSARSEENLLGGRRKSPTILDFCKRCVCPTIVRDGSVLFQRVSPDRVCLAADRFDSGRDYFFTTATQNTPNIGVAIVSGTLADGRRGKPSYP